MARTQRIVIKKCREIAIHQAARIVEIESELKESFEKLERCTQDLQGVRRLLTNPWNGTR